MASQELRATSLVKKSAALVESLVVVTVGSVVVVLVARCPVRQGRLVCWGEGLAKFVVTRRGKL